MACPEASRASHCVLLLIGPELVQRLGDEGVVDREDDGERRARARHGLDGVRIRHVVAAGAAVALGNRDAHQSDRRRLANERAWKLAGGVDVGRHRRHVGAGKRPGAIDECGLFGRERKVHQAPARRSNAARRRVAVAGSSSGSTRVSPTTDMKLVSPFHRGTTWMWR